MKEIYQLYDNAFKRILTLSDKAVINLINGLFGTDYPTDSKITYNWTEHEDKDLKKTLSDSILTINGRESYHIEAQITKDEEIVFIISFMTSLCNSSTFSFVRIFSSFFRSFKSKKGSKTISFLSLNSSTETF